MTLSVKHLTQSTKPATANSTDIDGPTWNEEHTISLTPGTLLGAWTSGDGTAAEVTIGTNLTLNSSGVLSASLTGGAVSASPTPLDNQIAVWTSATVIEGDANFTWDGSTLTVAGALAGVTSIDATTEATIEAAIDTLANLTITESQISDLQAYLTSVALNGISDVTITTPADNEVLAYNGAGVWINQTAAEAGLAAVTHTHTESDISDLGTTIVLDSDIGSTVQAWDADLDTYAGITPSANVQSLLGAASYAAMKSLLSITESDISDLGAYITDVTGDNLSALADVTITTGAQGDILYRNASAWVNLAPGTSGQFLQTNGAAANPSWATAAGSGDVAKVGTPADSQIGVWTGDGTIEGDASLTFDRTDLLIRNTGNDGNPSVQLGATTSDQFHIQTTYNTGTATLDKVTIHTETTSATADDGRIAFNVDGAGADQLTINDAGISVGGNIAVTGTVDGRDIATDGATLDTLTASPLTTKGDLYSYSTVDARLAVGTDGQVLTSDSAEVTGLKWATQAGGGDALVANPLSQFAATTSAQLAGVISDETGSGALVFGTSPTLVTPDLGTPSALTLTSATGLPIIAGTTGTLTVARGGTGATTLTGLVKGNGTGAFTAAVAGTDYEAVDADILRADTADNLTAAFTGTVTDDGTKTTGTYTPTPASGGQYKKIVHGAGAFTLAPYSPASNVATTLSLLIVNASASGTITTSGFTIVTGDAFDNTGTNKFLCRIEVVDYGGTEVSSLDVVALQ